jgi:hypothetical protein
VKPPVAAGCDRRGRIAMVSQLQREDVAQQGRLDVGPLSSEHLHVFLRRDTQVFDRDVHVGRIAPEVVLEAEWLVLGIQHEFGDAPPRRAHHLEP